MQRHYHTAQEQSTTTWSDNTVGSRVKLLTSSPAVSVRFTGWSLLASSGEHLNNAHASTTPTLLTHSQFGGGKFTVYPGSVALTNCLWERVYVTLNDSLEDNQTWCLFNNPFYGGTLSYRARGEAPVLLAYDNLFGKTTITKGGSSANFTHDSRFRRVILWPELDRSL